MLKYYYALECLDIHSSFIYISLSCKGWFPNLMWLLILGFSYQKVAGHFIRYGWSFTSLRLVSDWSGTCIWFIVSLRKDWFSKVTNQIKSNPPIWVHFGHRLSWKGLRDLCQAWKKNTLGTWLSLLYLVIVGHLFACDWSRTWL